MADNEKRKTGAVIVAAGSSERMGGMDKVFAILDGKPILTRVIEVFQACDRLDDIVIVLNLQNLERGKRLVTEGGWSKVKDVCEGGKRRQDSVSNGLNCLGECDWVVIHDGARPLVMNELIENGLDAAEETGAAIAAVPVTDTIKMASDDLTIQGSPPRQSLWAAQTPQVFRYDIITNAYRKLKYEVTDDARAVELMGGSVKIYQGSSDNIKITKPEDLAVAEILLKKRI
ncbi:MAG: 2-C-methyl-D-erythritol 4-phosphate cytidylyltransferase [Dehalococcoidales bacterium]|nr:MAG: 2-C-methyl-D-erythritol 4-phosphate cytidylyltransferase [Dehalococcoidales bacterium]